jgi:hypothetical protein
MHDNDGEQNSRIKPGAILTSYIALVLHALAFTFRDMERDFGPAFVLAHCRFTVYVNVSCRRPRLVARK